jgi:hypothetical protein
MSVTYNICDVKEGGTSISMFLIINYWNFKVWKPAVTVTADVVNVLNNPSGS